MAFAVLLGFQAFFGLAVSHQREIDALYASSATTDSLESCFVQRETVYPSFVVWPGKSQPATLSNFPGSVVADKGAPSPSSIEAKSISSFSPDAVEFPQKHNINARLKTQSTSISVPCATPSTNDTCTITATSTLEPFPTKASTWFIWTLSSASSGTDVPQTSTAVNLSSQSGTNAGSLSISPFPSSEITKTIRLTETQTSSTAIITLQTVDGLTSTYLAGDACERYGAVWHDSSVSALCNDTSRTASAFPPISLATGGPVSLHSSHSSVISTSPVEANYSTSVSPISASPYGSFSSRTSESYDSCTEGSSQALTVTEPVRTILTVPFNMTTIIMSVPTDVTSIPTIKTISTTEAKTIDSTSQFSQTVSSATEINPAANSSFVTDPSATLVTITFPPSTVTASIVTTTCTIITSISSLGAQSNSPPASASVCIIRACHGDDCYVSQTVIPMTRGGLTSEGVGSSSTGLTAPGETYGTVTVTSTTTVSMSQSLATHEPIPTSELSSNVFSDRSSSSQETPIPVTPLSVSTTKFSNSIRSSSINPDAPAFTITPYTLSIESYMTYSYSGVTTDDPEEPNSMQGGYGTAFRSSSDATPTDEADSEGTSVMNLSRATTLSTSYTSTRHPGGWNSWSGIVEDSSFQPPSGTNVVVAPTQPPNRGAIEVMLARRKANYWRKR